VNGQRAYKLARKDQEFELKPVPIKMSEFRITDIELPFLTYVATVSKGTYIRVLSETFAEKCGTTATTIELERTRIGSLKIEDCVDLDELTKENWVNYLYNLKDIFTELPRVILKDGDLGKYQNGNETSTESEDADTVIILSEENTCIGIGAISKNVLKVKHMFL
jgi:tRNA U55 pseudouridine synthase TruB